MSEIDVQGLTDAEIEDVQKVVDAIRNRCGTPQQRKCARDELTRRWKLLQQRYETLAQPIEADWELHVAGRKVVEGKNGIRITGACIHGIESLMSLKGQPPRIHMYGVEGGAISDLLFYAVDKEWFRLSYTGVVVAWEQLSTEVARWQRDVKREDIDPIIFHRELLQAHERIRRDRTE